MNDSAIPEQSFQGYLKPFPTPEDSSLLSLLAQSQMKVPSFVSSSMNFMAEPFSFEDPFENPDLEPVPLAPSCDMQHHDLHFLDSSLVNSTSDTVKLLSSILDPLTSAGNKRDFEFPSYSHQADEQRESKQKRQKLHHEYEASEEESVARFRPYQEEQWRIQFKKLIEFKLQTGHCCVPHSYPEDPILARWVKRQRYQYKKLNDDDPSSTMTTRRIQELESVGFVWHSHHAAWFEKLNELKAFKAENGHCNVPSHFPENTQLSTWVKCQRRQYKLYTNGKSSNMNSQRFELLDNLGFVFDIRTNMSSSLR